MSRIIEVSNTVIKQPELLPKAIKYMNDLGNYGVVEAQLVQDQDGRITSGTFHLVTKESEYGRGHVMLKFVGEGAPAYDGEGILQNGHFRLMGSSDFAESERLGSLIGDHYNAQVVRRLFEEKGQEVELTVADNGAITVDAYETGEVAAFNY